MHAPLLVTRDADLLDDLLRLAAAAGVVLDVAHDTTAALRDWATAPLVLVGADLSEPLAAEAPPRRPDVVLLARGEPDYRTALGVGAGDVVSLPAGETWLVEALTDAGDGGARTALTVGFVGGSGGVGTTTLASATAVLAARTRPVALVDLDPLGAGVERVVGLESAGVRWSDLNGSRGRLGSRALREALPKRGDLGILGWGGNEPVRDDVAVREVLAAARRGHDLVVLDLPRQLSGVAGEVASRCDHLVLVAWCSLHGAAAAMRSLGALVPGGRAIHLVARTAGGAVQPEALGQALGLPLAAAVGDQRGLTEHLDLGLGPVHARRGPVARGAAAVLSAVAGS